MATNVDVQEEYRWWLVDGDLNFVAGGTVEGDSVAAAIVGVSRDMEKLGEKGLTPDRHPYRLMIFKGGSVVAVRPPTVGIC